MAPRDRSTVHPGRAELAGSVFCVSVYVRSFAGDMVDNMTGASKMQASCPASLLLLLLFLLLLFWHCCVSTGQKAPSAL